MTRVVFDNTDLSEFGYTFHKDIDEVPEHDYEEVTILGKNGTVLIDNKRMKNVSESYDIAITDNSTADLDKLRNFLASKVGFKRLEDDIRPDRFVMAKFDGMNSRLPSDRSKATATMNFERKPERWLKSGETPTDASSQSVSYTGNPVEIDNPSGLSAVNSLSVSLNPKQDGTGDPSPTNIRPIHGTEEVTVTQTGHNIWDEEWEVGNLDASGKPSPYASYLRSKNFIPVQPNTAYYFKTADSLYIWVYDASKTCIGSGYTFGNVVNTTKTMPSNCHYIKFVDVARNTYNHDISINYPSTYTEYEPYNGNTYNVELDGYYNVASTDTKPYKFKAVGDVGGDRLRESIVGGTVAWNQLAKYNVDTSESNGITYTKNADGTVVADGTASGNSFLNGVITNGKANHVVLILGCPSGGSGATYYLREGYTSNKFDVGNGLMLKKSSDNFVVQINIMSGTTVSNLKFTPVAYDLTQMFGSTVADAIYAMEQSSAGSGVAWFKNLFPNDYYPYNSGELIHVSGLQSHDTVGFNQWDEQWELGWVDNTGANRETSTNIRSKDYIPVFPNTQYYFKTPKVGVLVYFDANKTCLGNSDANGLGDIPVPGAVRTTPSNCRYIRLWLTSGTTYNHDICINISDPSKNGIYKPYQKHTYPLDSTLTLRGVPKWSNGLYFDGDIYRHDGSVSRRYGVLDLGEQTWSRASTGRFYFPLASALKPSSTSVVANILCPKYISVSQAATWADGMVSLTTGGQLYVIDSAYDTAAGFKSAMSGVYLVYEKATATTETATPFEEIQILDPLGTEEYVSNTITPVGHNTEYLSRAVYGGSVDLISGVLTVDKGFVGDISALTKYGSFTTGTYSCMIRFTLPTPSTVTATAVRHGAISNMGVESTPYYGANRTNDRGSANVDFAITTDGSTLAIYDADTTLTGTTFMSKYAGFEMVYPLATPLTYNLTPQQISLLTGVNYISSSDEVTVTVTEPSLLENPTLFESKPLIRVYGNGVLTINNQYITVAENPYEYIDIDCDMMDCYYNSNNANQYVTFSTNDYITLKSGANYVAYDGTVEITPRWYEV